MFTVEVLRDRKTTTAITSFLPRGSSAGSVRIFPGKKFLTWRWCPRAKQGGGDWSSARGDFWFFVLYALPWHTASLSSPFCSTTFKVLHFLTTRVSFRHPFISERCHLEACTDISQLESTSASACAPTYPPNRGVLFPQLSVLPGSGSLSRSGSLPGSKRRRALVKAPRSHADVTPSIPLGSSLRCSQRQLSVPVSQGQQDMKKSLSPQIKQTSRGINVPK